MVISVAGIFEGYCIGNKLREETVTFAEGDSVSPTKNWNSKNWADSCGAVL